MRDPSPASTPAAGPTPFEVALRTRRGESAVVALAVLAILLLVAVGVALVKRAPEPIERWKGAMGAVGLAALIGAAIIHTRRRRTLRILRDGDTRYLVIDRESVRLRFPLAISGEQHHTRTGRVSMYVVLLKLVDATGTRGLLLVETRGAAWGPQADWLDGLAPGGPPCARFEAGLGALARLRSEIDAT